MSLSASNDNNYMITKIIIVCNDHIIHAHVQKQKTIFFSAHFPGYHFCGPGTNYLERIARGQLGINKLDEACRLHDLVYTDSMDLKSRMEADMKLEWQAWERVKAEDSGTKEKIAAWMVTNVMKLKRKWNNRSLRRESSKNRKSQIFGSVKNLTWWL